MIRCLRVSGEVIGLVNLRSESGLARRRGQLAGRELFRITCDKELAGSSAAPSYRGYFYHWRWREQSSILMVRSQEEDDEYVDSNRFDFDSRHRSRDF